MNLSARNNIVKQIQTVREIKNAVENYRFINTEIGIGKAYDISKEPKKHKKNVILISSGYSLDLAIPFLKSWEGDIICHYSQAVTLYLHGIIPTYIVALDPRGTELHLDYDNIGWFDTETKLIAHPGMHCSFIQNWPNKTLLYRPAIGDDKSFHRYYLNIMYSDDLTEIEDYMKGDLKYSPLIPTELPVFSNTASLEYVVAHFLEYDSIHLVGFDFKTAGENKRFTRKYITSDGLEASCDSKNGSDFDNDEALAFEKLMFLCAVRMFPHRVSMSGDSAITELPVINIKSFVKHQGKKAIFLNIEKLKNKIDTVLFKEKIAVIDHEDGECTFAQFKDPHWLYQTINKKANQHLCPECGFIDKYPTCPQCGASTKLLYNIDASKNIKRFRKLEELLK